MINLKPDVGKFTVTNPPLLKFDDFNQTILFISIKSMFAQIWLKSVCCHFQVVENLLCGILFVKARFPLQKF